MRPYRIAVAAASALVATVLCVPAAHASTVHPKNVYLSNWAGYATGPSREPITGIFANWVVPDATCNSTDDQLKIWVGLDGYGSQTIEQTGIAIDCSTGQPAYSGWYAMYPDAPVYYSDPVTPGDHISAAVRRSGSRYELTLKDHAHGWNHTASPSGPNHTVSVEVIMESPTAAFPDFGRMTFTNCGIDGTSLILWNPTRLDASNQNGLETRTMPVTQTGWMFHVNYVQE